MLRHRGRVSRQLVIGVVGVVVLIHMFTASASPAQARSLDEESRSFVDSVAETIYALAWPTAEYKGFRLQNVVPAQGGFDVLVRISGLSGFSGTALWLDIELVVREDALKDVRVARHNAILSPPFATMEALGNVLIQAIEAESGTTGRQSPPASSGADRGRSFEFANQCGVPVRLAIHYRQLDGTWSSAGWWDLGPYQTRRLQFSNSEEPRTRNSIFYYFAESKGGTYTWQGSESFDVQGRTLPMQELRDDHGPLGARLQCN